MDFPSLYPGAPTSPQSLYFYTAPSSPMQPNDLDHSASNGYEFEFKVTSRMFINRCESRETYPSFWWTKKNENEQQQMYRLPGRAKSFCSGEVNLPLKPPPRIQSTSVSSSPSRSPNSFLRNPFARSCAWNDDFDPFQFALEKVSDETRARMSFHRRSQSYSAYRTSGVAHWLDHGLVDQNNEHHKQGRKPNCKGSSTFEHGMRMKPNEHLKPRGPTLAEMLESRQPVYPRRGIHSTEPIAKLRSKNPMVRTTKDPRFGRRVKDSAHEPIKARNESNSGTESKMHRVMSFLFKLKKSNNNENRRWKLRRCLGYAPKSPPFMK
uniref:uncharacterized protein LOC122601853 n=1 Tax=Erigeron canadensis TaxID=72917 RepID=UPI001CB9671E|nr:uncharacterized protein LOC122601853 [Erigeron canadensis]